jgi:hypothetical protein
MHADLVVLGYDGSYGCVAAFVQHTKRVSPTRLVTLERHRYSVPASFANQQVSLRVYPERIVIAAEGRIFCEHGRVIARSHHLPGRIIYDWRPLRRSSG